MESPAVPTIERASEQLSTDDFERLDHTLGARASSVDLPADGPVPAARIGVLHWPPAEGSAAPWEHPGARHDGRPFARWRRVSAPLRTREVVLLHGLTGSAATQARVAAALATDGWSVRAIDLPGHGRSRWLDRDGTPVRDLASLEPAIHGLDATASTVARAIGALPGEDRPILVGHSWGAGIGAAAVLEAAPVSRLILVDPPFISPQAALDLTEELVGELRADMAEARSLLRETEPGIHPIDLAALAEALSQASALAITAAATQTGYGPVDFLRRWRAARPNLRVDVICGNPAHGGLVPARARLAFRFLLGPGRLHYMRDAGHSPQRSHFPQFMALLRGLLLAT